jgi:hypothetical protein
LEVLYAVPFCGYINDDGSIYNEDSFNCRGPSQIIYNNLGTLDNTSMNNVPYELIAKEEC